MEIVDEYSLPEGPDEGPTDPDSPSPHAQTRPMESSAQGRAQEAPSDGPTSAPPAPPESNPEQTNASTPNLASLRAEIDALDHALVETLVARFRIAEAVGRVKHRDGTLTLDPAREAEIVKRATDAARSSGVPEEGVRDVFWAVLGYCRQGVQRGLAPAPSSGTSELATAS